MSSETFRVLGSYAFALVIELAGFWFLYEAFLNPNTGTLPDSQQGILVGLISALMSGAATFVFGSAAAGAASRASEKATQSGVNAALTMPPAPASVTTIDAGPPATVTTTTEEVPSVADQTPEAGIG